MGSDGERGYVLQRLSYLERVLLVAESLLRRLGNQPEVVRLADDLLQAALAGGKEEPGRGHQQHCLRKATVETSAEREYISMLLSLGESPCFRASSPDPLPPMHKPAMPGMVVNCQLQASC